MTWLKNGFEALLSYSPTALIIGIVIIVLSVVDAFLSKKSGKERISSVTVAILSVFLLFVQGKSSELADEKSDKKLHDALQSQRDDLTGAFKTGTEQVMKGARDQTDAIERQANRQFGESQGATLGTKTCPTIFASTDRSGGRSHALVVINTDKKLNMYDLTMELTEFGPGAAGVPWSTTLQQQALRVPIMFPERARTLPFEFLSKMTDIDVQIILSTRATTCSGRIGLYDTGNNVWVNDHSIMVQQDGKVVYDQNLKLSPGLAKSKPDPQ